MAHRAPRAAVIMPAFNAEKTIERTVRSILAQTMEDLVLIVVNDGSKDGTGAILEHMHAEDPRVRPITVQNGGPARARNIALDAVPQGTEYLDSLEENTFDVVICHNVLEYVEDSDGVLKQLVRVLKPEGILSVVKHNLPGKVMFSAVLADDPKAALELLNPDHTQDSPFGTRNMYSNESLVSHLAKTTDLVETYGIRAFFGLSSNNEIKYTEEWYRAMLELETRAATMEEYRRIAFFHHLVFQKKA